MSSGFNPDIALTSPGSKTEEQLLTSELVKKGETDHKQLAGATGEQQDERILEEDPVYTESNAEAAEGEFKEEKKKETEVSPVALPHSPPHVAF